MILMERNVEAKEMSSGEMKYGRGGSDEPLRGSLPSASLVVSNARQSGFQLFKATIRASLPVS